MRAGCTPSQDALQKTVAQRASASCAFKRRTSTTPGLGDSGAAVAKRASQGNSRIRTRRKAARCLLLFISVEGQKGRGYHPRSQCRAMYVLLGDLARGLAPDRACACCSPTPLPSAATKARPLRNDRVRQHENRARSRRAFRLERCQDSLGTVARTLKYRGGLVFLMIQIQIMHVF